MQEPPHETPPERPHNGQTPFAFITWLLAVFSPLIWVQAFRGLFLAFLLGIVCIFGASLGGYAGVEWTKKLVGHRQSTGDAFALVLPVGLFLGRIGCHLHGCCQGSPVGAAIFARADAAGVPRWPAPQVEAAFQLLMLAIILTLHRRGLLRDRLFFLYLVCYGSFRFLHEFVRDTPKPIFGLSGYQFMALGMAGLGVWMLRSRSALPAQA